ncbi:extracellular solute-binding protein [Streptomyces sp. CT34]|uniref:ABC transporter substrate-binding protein n=1 Tax=Streptomyces sp. CT34 TaxID=1553907 RepID=UPI0018E36E2E|nr:extracellular solute-binding protein [Streptomyces sp. CT34]
MAANAVAVTGCSSSQSNEGSSSGQVILKVRLFGTFGYKEAGLFDAYMKLHPNIRIDYSTTEQESGYYTALQTSLASGSGLGDVQGLEVGHIADATHNLGDKFVDLNTLGASSLKNNFYDWKWQASMTPDGKQIGLGNDIGPLAICYRADLFEQAGLPTDSASVSALWAHGWDGYVQAGQKYLQHAPAGSHWVDTASGIYNTIIGQSRQQYYDGSGKVVWDSNPAVKSAWDESMKIATTDMTAGLSQYSQNWNTSFATGSFATIACPSWMIGYIKSQAGSAKGRWSVATIPGGGGDWGGSYLAIPKASKHQKEAYDLIAWLTSARQEATLFANVGMFPSNRKAAADPSVTGATDTYFSGPDGKSAAAIGKIFGDSAAKLTVATTGSKDGTIRDAIDRGIARVETQHRSPDESWSQVKTDIAAAIGN